MLANVGWLSCTMAHVGVGVTRFLGLPRPLLWLGAEAARSSGGKSSRGRVGADPVLDAVAEQDGAGLLPLLAAGVLDAASVSSADVPPVSVPPARTAASAATPASSQRIISAPYHAESSRADASALAAGSASSCAAASAALAADAKAFMCPVLRVSARAESARMERSAGGAATHTMVGSWKRGLSECHPLTTRGRVIP